MQTATTPRFASALSVDAHSDKAEQHCIDELAAALGGQRPDLLVVFVSHHHGAAIEQLGPRLAKALHARVVIGCTGEGVIGGTREIEQDPALAVWAAVLPNTEVSMFEVKAELGADDSPQFSGVPAIRDRSRASIVLFGDPFSFPMDDYLKTLEESFPGVPVVGGMASGGMGPGQNLLVHAQGLASDGAIGVVLEGDIEVCSVVSQGCRPVGKPWVITACHQQLIQKLGGRPALDVFQETLQALEARDQKLFRHQPFVGLAVDPAKSTFERADFVVRGIIGIQVNERTVAVSDVPRRGMTVQFLVRDAESASEDLAILMDARAGAVAHDQAQATGALLFSCNGRGSRMFNVPDHDAKRVREGLKADVPIAGFFAMGEIGPIGKRNFLHGYTASVAVFRVRKS